ncbi:hypothetical protein D9M69_703020 [compost metagenome]
MVTALYLEGDPYLESDTVFGVTSSDLVVAPRQDEEAPLSGLPAIRYDFRLASGSMESGRVGADVSKIRLD